MPTYDYVCSACGHALEIFQTMSESPKRKCPKCGKSKLERRIGAGAGFLFKGSGFYLTDYRSKAYTQAARNDAEGGAASKGTPASESPTPPPAADPKPAAKSDSPAASAAPSKSAAKKPGPGSGPSSKKSTS